MKQFFALILFAFLTISLFAETLVLIPVKGLEETRSLFNDPTKTVHFYRDEFVIATIKNDGADHFITLDKNPWQPGISYYLVYIDNTVDKDFYTSAIAHRATILHDGGWHLIVSSNESRYGQLPPAKNDGMVRIFQRPARLTDGQLRVSSLKISEPDPFILGLFEQVNTDSITHRVQHLEDYGTRDAYMPMSIQAQEWIEEKFLSWGLDVEVMDFYMPGGPSSDNVIATLTGTEYPDEFVVLGGHYDSISWSGDAPGADDNASGTSGVMEIARILSQYTFKRSIIFCAFSGEEYGLFGSAAYASRAAENGKNILGYFNMDMIGYLKPGNTMMTSLIYPASAQELADFYTDVTALYLPDFLVIPGNLIGGDSDHTSFNNNGYMGIFPFEDINNYSPYIHTSNDLVGPSYNNEEQATVFTKAVLASVVTMAEVAVPASVEESAVLTTVFPNPAKDYITIALPTDQKATIAINDASGKTVKQQSIEGSGTISVTGLAPGTYFVVITSGGEKKVHKVMVQQ